MNEFISYTILPFALKLKIFILTALFFKNYSNSNRTSSEALKKSLNWPKKTASQQIIAQATYQAQLLIYKAVKLPHPTHRSIQTKTLSQKYLM